VSRYKTKLVSQKIKGGFIGMNCWAAKSHDIPYPYPCSTILVYKGLDHKSRIRTARHERVESDLMRFPKSLPYKKAHRVALRKEVV
jgi:hypothetical protein